MRIECGAVFCCSALIVMSGCGVPTEVTRPRIITVNSIANELALAAREPLFNDYQDVGGLGLPLSGGVSISFERRLCRADSSGSAIRNAAGIPRDLTLRYECGRSIGNISSSLTGVTRIQDLGGTYAARITYSEMRYTATTPDFGSQVTVSGEVEVATQTPTVLRLTQRITAHLIVPAGETRKSRDLVITVTDTAGFPPANIHFTPPTEIDITGRLILIASAGVTPDTVGIDVTTPVKLQPDDRCLLSRFRSGELLGVADHGFGPIRIRFSCQ